MNGRTNRPSALEVALSRVLDGGDEAVRILASESLSAKGIDAVAALQTIFAAFRSDMKVTEAKPMDDSKPVVMTGPPPAELSSAQLEFLVTAMQSRTPVLVRLDDGLETIPVIALGANGDVITTREQGDARALVVVDQRRVIFPETAARG